MPDTLFVFGASGHAKVVIDCLRRGGHRSLLLVDDDPGRTGARVLGETVAGDRRTLQAAGDRVRRGIVAIGSNDARSAVARWLEEAGFTFVAAVDPAAVVSEYARIEAGSLVMPGAIINADAVVGRHAIVNTAATVDHDCRVGDAVHLAPGVHLCGAVEVGERSFIGAGSVVMPGVRIGREVIVGAGATVLADLPDGCRAVGSPCRPIGAGR